MNYLAKINAVLIGVASIINFRNFEPADSLMFVCYQSLCITATISCHYVVLITKESECYGKKLL